MLSAQAMPMPKVLLVLYTIAFHLVSEVGSEGSSRTKLLIQLLKGYDHRISPNFAEDKPVPTTVYIQINVDSVDSFSEATMDYSLLIFLQQKWTDHRLAWQTSDHHEPLELDAKFMDALWVPDLFFSNEKSGSFHFVTVSNKMMHLFRNGSILYSIRLSLTLSCPMHLQKYPFDSQVCNITMESYGHTTNSMVFRWYPEVPLDRNPALQLPQFDLLSTPVSDCTKIYGGANYTCLQASLFLKRQVGYFVIQIYVPSILIVALSWVSFWLSAEAIPARISLGVLTILTMTTQTSGANASLPRVSYIKAIDIWMLSCLLFVFVALLEFSVVNYISRIEKIVIPNEMKLASQKDLTTGHLPTSNGDKKRRRSMKFWVGKKKAMSVDRCSRVIFPLAFGLFNLVYWLVYMT